MVGQDMDSIRGEAVGAAKTAAESVSLESLEETAGRMDENNRNSGQRDGEKSLLGDILDAFPGKNCSGKNCSGKRQDIRTYSPLTLAYIGDAVYDLIVRTVVVEQANRPANELHRLTIKYVSAPAQARIVQALSDSLTEEEQAVYRRGKNAKPHTTAKNASHADYMKATGFEAVLGYLYLSDNMDRVLELVKTGIQRAGMVL